MLLAKGNDPKRMRAFTCSENMTVTAGKSRKWSVFALVASAIFMSTLDSSIVNIALPAIMDDLRASFETIQWIVVIYLLTISSTLLAFGRLSDIKGRRWVYCSGFFLFTLGSLLCGVAGFAGMLIASRAFQAIGSAMIMACSPALVVDAFPLKERGKALGLVGTVVATGLTAGPALGGVILEHSHWRTIFLINIPIGAIALAAAGRILNGTAVSGASHEPFDWPGAVCLTVTLFSLMTFLLHLNQWALSSPRMIVLIAISAMGLLLFIFVERRTSYPIADIQILKNRFFMVSVICATILFAGLFSITFLMPFYLMRPAGLDAQRAGTIMMIPFAFLFFISPLSGWLSDRVGSRVLCFGGMGLLAVSLFCFTTLYPTQALFAVCWRLGLAGMGVALFLPAYNASAMSAVPPKKRGIASGMIAAGRNFGMVCGVALSGVIFSRSFTTLSGGMNANVYEPGLRSVFLEAFHNAMLAGTLLVAGGWLLTFLRGQARIDR
jgi:EmrB/QacA subfamily drug resistance transporter